MTKLTALDLYILTDTIIHSLQFGSSWSGVATKEARDGVLNKLQKIMSEMEVELSVELWRKMTNEQLLNSLQGTMATIDPYSVKKEAIDEYHMDTIEERLTRIEDKVDLLITQLKIEFYKKND
jgi:hypothetical protein